MFDEQEFLDAARHLRSASEQEGFQRSAISRAYYAAFLHARRILRESGTIPQTGSGSDHAAVAGALRMLDEHLGKEFRFLQQLRRNADYDDQAAAPDRLARNAQTAIDLAEFIRRELQRLT